MTANCDPPIGGAFASATGAFDLEAQVQLLGL
jgi:hypothetical protein